MALALSNSAISSAVKVQPEAPFNVMSAVERREGGWRCYFTKLSFKLVKLRAPMIGEVTPGFCISHLRETCAIDFSLLLAIEETVSNLRDKESGGLENEKRKGRGEEVERSRYNVPLPMCDRC